MAKTTKRVAFQRTITYTYFADMPGFSTETDAVALTAANLPGGSNSIGELLAGTNTANGTINKGAWSVSSAGVNIEPYSMWVASLATAIGARHTPTTGGNRLYVATTNGTTAATEPTWSTTIGASVTSGTVTYRVIDKFGSVLTFAVSTAYTAGQVVKPTSGSTQEYVVTTAGTSAASAPTWGATLGQAITGGTAVFTLIAL